VQDRHRLAHAHRFNLPRHVVSSQASSCAPDTGQNAAGADQTTN
jgi:hypothetical protein